LFRLIDRLGDDSRPGFDYFRDHGEPAGGFFFRQVLAQARPDAPLPGAEARSSLIADPQASLSDRLGALSAAAVIVLQPESGGAADRDAADAMVITGGFDNLEDASVERSVTVAFGAMTPLQGAGTPGSPFTSGHAIANYVVAYSSDFTSAIVYDANSKTLLTGGPGDWPELGAGDDDVLELDGDFSAGFSLPEQPMGLDTVVLRAGHDYNLVANDNNVEDGETLTINAMPLGADDHVMFDGSAETNGRFVFFGSQSDDFFFGGGGDDRIVGLGGGDTLTGGGGSDIFVYTGAAESSGVNYDTIADFDPTTDRIDLPGGVTGFADAIEGGSLSTATFNDDLAAVLAGLAPAQAVWFAPDAGDLAGQIFLIVDGNGEAGYQEGEDFVIAFAGAPLTDLTGHTDIFI